jgi:amino-acid N-acetyltransferase
MTVAIRDSTESDRAAILALLSSCGLPVEDIDSCAALRFLVAELDGAVVGCTGWEAGGAEALIRSLAVAPLLRDTGIGSSLLREVETRCHAEGVRAAFVLTTTAEKYLAGHGYLRLDRSEAPTSIQATSEFRTTCPVSAVFMRKPI